MTNSTYTYTATATANNIRRHKRSQSMLNIHSASDKAASTMSFLKRKMSCHKRSQSQLTMSMSKTSTKPGFCTSPTPSPNMSLATLLRSFPETLMMTTEATDAAAAAANSLVVTPCQTPTKRPRLSSASSAAEDDIGSVCALPSPPRLRPRQRTTLVLVPSTSDGASETQIQTQPQPNVDDLLIPTLDDEESRLPPIHLQPRRDRTSSVVFDSAAASLFLPSENDDNEGNLTNMVDDADADAEVASLTSPPRTRSSIWRLAPRPATTTSITTSSSIRLSKKEERDLWFLLE